MSNSLKLSAVMRDKTLIDFIDNSGYVFGHIKSSLEKELMKELAKKIRVMFPTIKFLIIKNWLSNSIRFDLYGDYYKFFEIAPDNSEAEVGGFYID